MKLTIENKEIEIVNSDVEKVLNLLLEVNRMITEYNKKDNSHYIQFLSTDLTGASEHITRALADIEIATEKLN